MCEGLSRPTFRSRCLFKKWIASKAFGVHISEARLHVLEIVRCFENTSVINTPYLGSENVSAVEMLKPSPKRGSFVRPTKKKFAPILMTMMN